MKGCVCTIKHGRTGTSVGCARTHMLGARGRVLVVRSQEHAGPRGDVPYSEHTSPLQAFPPGPPGVQSRPWLGAGETYAPLLSRRGGARGGNFTFFLDQKTWQWKVSWLSFWVR